MDPARLREALRPHIQGLGAVGTHATLPDICKNLGLPEPGPEDNTKRQRVCAAFDAVPDDFLPDVARRFLERHQVEASKRNEIQDILWADTGAPEIPKKFRREVARGLAGEDLFLDDQQFDRLLDGLWVLDDPLDWLGGSNCSLRAEIDQHVHRNPEDWSVEYLFEQLGAFDATDRRFALFLEGLASSDVRPDEESQRRFVKTINESLRACGVEMRETDSEGGYPVFTVVSTRAAPAGRPKNLIFASSLKPDIRFRDAVNNDIEIASNADTVLVYDRPISMDGLRWRDLQCWWSQTMSILDDEQAKATLYRRLRDSLPQNSPAQSLLFDAYHRSFSSAVPDLPALLPEVWLHWDPKTVKERGPNALLRFRMDFLLLFPQGARIVVEVDGKHHFAETDGRADAGRYATMVAADRDLKLAGYEVFRFGAEELQGDAGRNLVKKFFDALFKRYGVVVTPAQRR